jgi:hypothetical protein
MAEAISATRSAPIVETTAGQSALRAGQTPAAANESAQTVPAAPAATPTVTPNPARAASQVAAQHAAADIGPEGRLMQLLRALNPPVPPPIDPPPRSVKA